MDETSCIEHGVTKNKNKIKVVPTKSNVRGTHASIESFGSCFLATTNEAKLKESKHCLVWVQQLSAKYICKMKK
eukprot:2118828-Ditylum_brightwellii.AAC.1